MTESNQYESRKRYWINNIVVGLIVSTIFAILQPNVEKLNNFLFSNFENLYQESINSSYANAVVANNAIFFSYVSTVYSCAAGILLGISAITISAIIKKFSRSENGSETKTQAPRSKVRITFSLLIFMLCILILIVLLYWNIFLTKITIQASATFERRVMAVSTHISEVDRKRLYALWSFVMNKKDYGDLMVEIERIASELNVPIPRRFI